VPRAPSRGAIGRLGEELACQELAQRGYEILARNWRCPEGEVAIIARVGVCLAFVEVKTRRPQGGLPEEGLTPRKAARIVAAARHYLGQMALEEPAWRVDLVAIALDTAGRVRRISITPAIEVEA